MEPTPVNETIEKHSSEDIPTWSHTEKNTPSRLSTIWRHTRTTLTRIHPTWYVTISFLFLITGIIMHYEYREDMRWGWFKEFPLMEVHIPAYHHISDRWWDDFDRRFSDIDRDIRDMARRHERIMDTLWDHSLMTGVGQYRWAKIIDDSTLTYSITKGPESLSGVITSTENGTLKHLETELKNLGYTVNKKDTSLLFSGSIENTNTLMMLLK
jgi:hypothetical protein